MQQSSAQMRRTEVYVSADSCSTGLELRVYDRPDVELIVALPSELGLSERLSFRVAAGARWFNAVWEPVDVADRVRVLGDAFDDVGRLLAEEVARELGPTARVVYMPRGGWCRQFGCGSLLVVQE